MKKIIISLISLSLILPLSAQKFEGWKKAETQHFNFIYENSSKAFAEEYALYADEAWNKISKFYDFPQNKTNVFITDRTNTVNAFTYSVPIDIVMFTSPAITPEFGFRENWQKLFFTHELIHVANMKFTGEDSLVSKLVGPYINVFSLMDTPNWALEGLATFLETQLTEGGRGRSPYFEILYKAPTIHNGFISFSDIGDEEEPPRGQSYVMGYLILQSIADRWGLDAVSDIERNHSKGYKWDESVKLVTGKTPEDIYNDVRIALSKKYQKERDIPEGVTITPRANKTYYFNPSIVFDDGSFIALRKRPGEKNAVVKYDPSARSGSNWYIDTNADKDLNTIYEETVLFTGEFPDTTAVTADENGKVYASLQIERNDRYPGYECEYALYSFSEKTGLNQLTNGTSIFQPTVSRDGKKLFGIAQKGLRMGIVSINPLTGEITEFLNSEKFNYIQPSVNSDGTKLTFIECDDQRARICVMDLSNNNKTYKIVANNQGTITDPAYPHWNSDGKLLYTSNDRGRLEVFEVDIPNDSVPFDMPVVSVPVVSDPIGALWAYKTDKGILYASYASTGNVIKMKPLNEWGKVPSFEGPSKPGSIVCFGNTHTDYPDFNPYPKLSEVEITDDDNNKKVDEKVEPLPVRGKRVAHRSEESKEKAENLPEPQTVLGEQKGYFPWPTPVLYMPTIGIQEIPESDHPSIGIGYSFVALTPRLQMNSGAIIANFDYYFGMNNFEGLFGGMIPFGDSNFAFWLERNFNISELTGTKTITEDSSLSIGYTNSIYNRKNHYNRTNIAFNSFINGHIKRTSDKSFSIVENLPVTCSISGFTGFSFGFEKERLRDIVNTYDFSVNAIGLFDFDLNRFFIGAEGLAEGKLNSRNSIYEYTVGLRYTDFPVLSNSFGSKVTIPGIEDDCIFPGKLLLRLAALLPDLPLGLNAKIITETMFTFGSNNVNYTTPSSGLPLNITQPDAIYLGGELGIDVSDIKLYGGAHIPFNLNTRKFDNWSFYFNCKATWWSF